jgi:hypothetical protein
MFIIIERNYNMNSIREQAMLQKLDDVFAAAVQALRDNFAAIPIQVDVLGTELHYGLAVRADKHIRLTIGNNQIQYFAEIKNNLTRANIGLMIQHRNMLPGPLLLVTNHVNDVMAEYLKEFKIEFIDTAGNVYIHQLPIYIYVKGNKLKDKYRNPPPGQAFRPTGLKVVFTFLCDPQIIKYDYRAIAHTAGVALGNIGWIIADLKRQGFILDMGRRGRKLIQKQRLLDLFVEEYPIKLRRQLFLGKFRGDQDWWDKQHRNLNTALWGGEIAAAKMGNYLKPETITVYVKQQRLNDFLLQNRLKRDAAGEVEILKLFWDTANLADHNGLVHPILIYADLMATANQRNIEAAKAIYEEYVVRFIGDD